eukprot:2771493-Prymnesium_polylepis.1
MGSRIDLALWPGTNILVLLRGTLGHPAGVDDHEPAKGQPKKGEAARVVHHGGSDRPHTAVTVLVPGGTVPWCVNV